LPREHSPQHQLPRRLHLRPPRLNSHATRVARRRFASLPATPRYSSPRRRLTTSVTGAAPPKPASDQHARQLELQRSAHRRRDHCHRVLCTALRVGVRRHRLAGTAGNGHDHWRVTFTVASRDESTATAERLGAVVISSDDTGWAKTPLIRDPQSAELTLSQSSAGCRRLPELTSG
jgi:hypothetical protein